ncbi:MAG: hypothetical protein H8D94_00415 [Candidatus Pelagibacter sp.]|nr:hypothetical protein [Candidatus Pelagibacter sp.]
MKVFRVENNSKQQTIIVTLFNPPYEDINILNKTGWDVDKVIITEITMDAENDDIS